jgi:hypothetical protein
MAGWLAALGYALRGLRRSRRRDDDDDDDDDGQ